MTIKVNCAILAITNRKKTFAKGNKNMLFWSFIILFVVGIILYKVFEFELLGELVTAISGFAVLISLFLIIGEYTTMDSYLEKTREQYKAITYKIESEVCRDEFGLLNKEVIDEIQEWNKDVRFYQNIQDNFWVGIYYPNVFDEFETIDYESFEKK